MACIVSKDASRESPDLRPSDPRHATGAGLPSIIRGMANAFKTIALIGKYKSPEIAEPLLELSRFLQNRGVRVLLDPLTAAHVAHSQLEVVPLEESGRLSDLAIVIGGDGTMLNIARTLAPFDVAVVGVNQGRF